MSLYPWELFPACLSLLWLVGYYYRAPWADLAEIAGCAAWTVTFALGRMEPFALYYAGATAYLVWKWRRKGGGKGLRRLLKRLFRPVRRTAPVPTV